MRVGARARLPYVALALGTIVLGLTIHEGGAALGLGPAARDVLGDGLWAVMIVWWLGALAPSAPLAARAGVALAICAAVEEHVWPLVADGSVRPVVHEQVPLAEAGRAHAIVEESSHVGKVLLVAGR